LPEHTHRYRTGLHWRGSTGDGYAAYDRAHTVTLGPAGTVLKLSADAAFRGSPELPSPEQLLLAAASSCQLLSFLALAAREGVDVQGYEDAAEAVMPDDVTPVRVTQITLRPRVVVAAEVAPERVRALLLRAHHECYVANSLTTTITLEPEILRPDGRPFLELQAD